MVRGAFRLAAGACLLSVLFVTMALSPLARAQGAIPPSMRGDSPVAAGGGNSRPGDLGGEPGVVPIDDGGDPIIAPPLVLGSSTTPAQIAGVVHHRLSGARVPFPYVLPAGTTRDTARELGLLQGPGQPIVMIGLNRLVVGFTDDATTAQASDMLRQRGVFGTVRAVPGLRSVFTVDTPSAYGAFQRADALASDPAFRFVHVDTVAQRALAGVAPELTVSRNGMPFAPGATINFGATDIGTPIDVQFTATNTGGSDLIVGGPLLPNGFTLVSPLPVTIAPAASANFTIRLEATSAGFFTGDADILTNTPVNPFSFTVEGTVNAPVGPAALRVTLDGSVVNNSGTVNFGVTTQGSPITKTFTLFNTGGDPLTVGTVSVPAGFNVTQQPTSPVAGGTGTTFTVVLPATTDGAFTGALTFLTNDNTNNPFAITISGVVNTSSGDGIDDPLFPNQWHLANTGQGNGTELVDVGVEPAWEITLGNGVIVALMDDGTQPGHPDYAQNFRSCDNCINFFDFDLSLNRGRGSHGTAVAGLIAAVANSLGGRGVAPEALIIPTSFYQLNGNAMAASEVAANWAATATADAAIHSNSWGYVPSTYLTDVERDAIVDLTANSRGGRGMLFLFATANGGVPTLYGSALASMAETVGVGGMNNRGQRARFGPVAGANYGFATDVVGPTNGGSLGITTTDVTAEGGYNPAPSDNGGDFTASFGGTSAATPIVAGVAALAVAENSALHADQVRRILQHTANQNITRTALFTFENTGFGGASGFSESFGYGLVNAETAVLAAQRALAQSNLTWPAPVPTMTVAQGANSTTVSWTNPPSGPKGEFSGTLLVRSTTSSLWRPVDGVQYAAGQIPAFGVEILAVGSGTSFVDDEVSRANNAVYSLFTFNAQRRYSFGVTRRVVRIEPVSVFFDDFESVRGWQFTGDWERGVPEEDFLFLEFLDGDSFPVEVILATPPRVRGFNRARSGENVFATNLIGNYANDTAHHLYSPVFDLRNTNSQSVSMTFWELLEIESVFNDRIIIEIVTPNINDPVVIRTLRNEVPPNSYEWTPRFYDLTPQLGTQFRVRFTLQSDIAPVGRPGSFQGWFLEDFRIGATGGTIPPIGGDSRIPGLVRLPPPGGFVFGMTTVPVSASPDINADGKYDMQDVSEVLKRYGATKSDRHFLEAADLNDDGVIDLQDLVLVFAVANDPSSYTPIERPLDAPADYDPTRPGPRRGAWLHELLNR